MPDSEDDVKCPVCRDHTEAENIQSQGMILTGIKALLEGDETTITSIFESMTPYDGHTAIGLCAGMLHDLCMITNLPMRTWLDNYRKALNEAQATAD